MFIVSSIRKANQSRHLEKNIDKSRFYLGQFVGVILSLGFCVIGGYSDILPEYYPEVNLPDHENETACILCMMIPPLLMTTCLMCDSKEMSKESKDNSEESHPPPDSQHLQKSCSPKPFEDRDIHNEN